MASIRKKGKYYYARFYDRTRKPKRKEVALRTTRKEVARRKVVKLEEERDKGEYDPWEDEEFTEPLTVAEAIEQFLESKSHLRPDTLRTYRGILKRFRDTLPVGLQMTDLTAKHIRPRVHDPAISTASKRKRYRHIRVFIKWAQKNRQLTKDPLETVRQPKAEKKQAEFLTTAQLEKLLTTIDEYRRSTRDAAGRAPDVKWLTDIIRLAVCTGLRRSELLNLHWSDVDLTNNFLTVRNRESFRSKSGHERSVPLAGDAADVLTEIKESWEGALEGPIIRDRRGLPVKPDRVSKRFKFFVREAELLGQKRLRFHSLRHTCGSWLAMRGVPLRVIQAILGHSSIQVTERYSHLQPEVMTKAMQETFG